MFNLKERKKERLRNIVPDTISAQTYNLIIGACLLYGFLANALIVHFCSQFFMNMNQWVFIIGYFVCCIAGIIVTRSKKPIMSFIGYNLVVLPIGAVLSVCLPDFSGNDIMLAIVLTGAVVAVMMALATLFPKVFSKMGLALLIALTVALIAELVAMLLGYTGSIFSVIFVVIFSLYIGYDWYKAKSYPKTLDNAIDSALDLYLDIINLFIRLLDIISRVNGDD